MNISLREEGAGRFTCQSFSSCISIVFVFSRLVLFGPPRDKTNKMTCAPSEDSDQPRHPPSLIRVFAVRLKNFGSLATCIHWAPSEYSYQTARLRRLVWIFAGCTCWFCHAAALFSACSLRCVLWLWHSLEIVFLYYWIYSTRRGKTIRCSAKPRVLYFTPTRLINSIIHGHSCKILHLNYFFATFVIRIWGNHFVSIYFRIAKNNDILFILIRGGVHRSRNRVKDRWTQSHLVIIHHIGERKL